MSGAQPLVDIDADADAGERLAQSDETTLYDERRLLVLVRFSAALRLPMVLAAFVTAAIAWGGGAPPPLVGVWLMVTLIVREARAAILLRLARRSAQPIAERLRQVTWLTLAQGLTHGCAAFFMLWLDTSFDAVLTMVLMSLSAGAVSTTFTVLSAFIAYACATLVPPALLWLGGGSGLQMSIGTLVLIFIAVQIRFARQNMQLFEESYQMRLENMTLLRQLSEEREQLARARDTAVQADRSKSRFLAAASHDLRQPLQSLSLNSGALSRIAMPAEGQQIALEMSQGIEALRQMLDALLDVSKLDSGAVAPVLRRLSLPQLLEGLSLRFRPAAQSKGLTLSHDCPSGLAVVSDVDMLLRVLSNLIDNAIKFTERGVITLRAERVGALVLLSVSDSGIGIGPADQMRVFDDLVQIANPERDRARGHGLGLGIVRRLVQILGADCSLHSEPGVGSHFVLKLPAVDDDVGPVVAAGHASAPSLIERRVLVLDDDADVRSAYTHALASLGCRVFTAASVDAAMQDLRERAPEIALVDYRLAGTLDGLQAIERLRALMPGLPAALVSADTDPSLSARAAQLGVSVLRKPVSEAALVQLINDALHGRGPVPGAAAARTGAPEHAQRTLPTRRR